MPSETDKIFCFGLPKTGLTSLLQFMKDHGYASGRRARHLRSAFFKHDFEALEEGYDDGCFFCDIPTPFVYEAVFAKYGDRAKYILTVRETPELWYQSLLRHNIYAHPLRHKHRRTFGRFYPHGFEREHIEFYERHNERVKDFFYARAADRFLVMKVAEPDAVETLCQFLEIEPRCAHFPVRNVSGGRRETLADSFKRHYNHLVQPAYARVAPNLFRRPASPVAYLKTFQTLGRSADTAHQ
ncbi:sulfotransferase [Breoghania sp.]|uniref:sulfotransferase n=1 Tax=Breoghania sp. TaxID=2065378 RepID=UPI002AA7ED01|nr:sulfotransferase [Breoghania sp.]